MLFLQLSLLQNAIESARWHFFSQVPGHGNSPEFLGMLELTVTAFCTHQIPAIILNEFDNFSDLHPSNLTK